VGGLIFTKVGSYFFASFSCQPSQLVLSCGSLQFLTKIGPYQQTSSSLAHTGKSIWAPKIFNFFGGGGVVSSSLVGCGSVSAFLGGGGVEDSSGAGEVCGLGDGGGDGG